MPFTFRMRKKTQLSHWPESVHSNTLQTRSSPTPPKQLWLLWNIGKRQSFHHCLTIQRYQNWQVHKNSNKHAVHHPPKNISHTQCPHISRMFLLKNGLIFGVRTIPTFHLREFLLSTFWAQKSSASWFFSGTWSHFHYSNSMFSRPSVFPLSSCSRITTVQESAVLSPASPNDPNETRESTTCSTRASTPVPSVHHRRMQPSIPGEGIHYWAGRNAVVTGCNMWCLESIAILEYGSLGMSKSPNISVPGWLYCGISKEVFTSSPGCMKTKPMHSAALKRWWLVVSLFQVVQDFITKELTSGNQEIQEEKVQGSQGWFLF